MLLTGARQVGKTTLLEAIAEPARRRVTLDDIDQRELARNDPALFLRRNPAPLLIDEVQYAPQLFSALKLIVDREKTKGAYWLTGSQKFHLMQGVSESLAGRVAILDLLGLSQAEQDRRASDARPFLPNAQWLDAARRTSPPGQSVMELYERIWLGSYPSLAIEGREVRETFYRSYVQTYIQRDVRALTRVGDEAAFARFLRAAAARTAQLINYADMARDVDIDMKTAKAWTSILEASGLIYLLQPYHANVTKRLVKTPKLYFLDTGLCAYLAQWSSPEVLESGAMSGAILETYMFAEILKSYWHTGSSANFFFYRDRDQVEIDLIIERDGVLHPIEFKKTASPSLRAAATFRAIAMLDRPQGPGAIVCLTEKAVPLSENVTAVPITMV